MIFAIFIMWGLVYPIIILIITVSLFLFYPRVDEEDAEESSSPTGETACASTWSSLSDHFHHFYISS